MVYYVTFGINHTHNINDQVYDKNCVGLVEAPDYEAARAKVFQLFGSTWSFLHIAPPNMNYFPRGFVSV